MARITVKEIVNTPVENYSKMKTEEMEKTLNAFRSQLKRRLTSLDKGHRYSYAFSGLADSLGKSDPNVLVDESTGEVKYSHLMSTLQDSRTMSRNQMLHEIAAIQSFFASKTSTVTGIKKINKEQDKRLFGDNGITMTDDERAKYWTFVMEAERIMQITGRSELYASTQIQNMLANMKIELGPNFKVQDIGVMVEEALNRLHAENTNDAYSNWSAASPVYVYDTPTASSGSTSKTSKSTPKSKSKSKTNTKSKSKNNTKTNSKTKTNTNTKPKNNTKREHVPKTFKDRFFAGLNKLGSLFTK